MKQKKRWMLGIANGILGACTILLLLNSGIGSKSHKEEIGMTHPASAISQETAESKNSIKNQKESSTENRAENNTENRPEEKYPVALTFDDGPDPTWTQKLLEGLRKRNVKATFFLLGSQIEQYPKLAEQIVQEGHLIGCHSYEHVDFSQLSEGKACAQISKTCALIRDMTGKPVEYVRPPYGKWLPCLDQDFSMVEVSWDIDPLDWATHDASLVTTRILKEVKPYDIILLHDASESSVQAAFAVIDALQNDCYEFVTVDELFFP